MSAEPPDKPSGRPPIRSLDEPIDDSGADEVIERLKSNRQAAESALPEVAVLALKLKALGFSVMPLPTEKKAPPLGDWDKAVTANPAVFLKNPGTHNYALLPPPGCFGWDVDKDAPALLEQLSGKLGRLPISLVTKSPNGEHQFYRWPADLAHPKGPMFGSIVTRWPIEEVGEGRGYLVGPGSVVRQDDGTLRDYVVFGLDDTEVIADLPRPWAEFALNWRPAREVKVASGPLAEVGAPKYELPESVPAGGRYAAILAYTASMYNRRFGKDEMWGAVQSGLAPRFSEPLSLPELRTRFERAIRDMDSRLGEPKDASDFSSAEAAPVALGDATGAEHTDPSQVPLGPTPLFVEASAFADELRSREPIAYLVPGWVPAAGLTVVAGHPKSMKSLAVLQMLGAFVAGGDFLGADIVSDDVRVGLYLTREGSHSEMLARVDALRDRHGPALGDRLRFAYEQPIEFDAKSYATVSSALTELESEMSGFGRKLRVMLVLDPLRDLMPLDGDENEAKTMAVVKRWCRSLIADFGFLSIVLVHHLRKSASGSTGLEMSGSGAMYGAVDSTVIWKARKEDNLDEDDDSPVLVSVSEMFGTYRVESRGEAPFKGRWRYDVAESRIVPGIGRQETASGRAVPGTAVAGVLDVLRGMGIHGGATKTVAEQAGVSEDNVRKQLHRLSDKGQAVRENGLWFAWGFAPFQQPDVILPLTSQEEEPAPAGDDEVWDDPVHRI